VDRNRAPLAASPQVIRTRSLRGLLPLPSILLAACLDAGSSVSGQAVTASGVPISGARVTLAAPAGGPDNPIRPLATVHTDSLGCFRVFALHAPGPGQLQLTLEALGAAPLHLSAPVGNYALEATLGTGLGADTSYGRLVRLVVGSSTRAVCPVPR
jgi:hypothetical protein